VVVFAGIRLASLLVKTGQDGQRPDYFRADKAWWYITLLTIGYMIARGLAKSGSREPCGDHDAARRQVRLRPNERAQPQLQLGGGASPCKTRTTPSATRSGSPASRIRTGRGGPG
jgi:hypothetical protein